MWFYNPTPWPWARKVHQGQKGQILKNVANGLKRMENRSNIEKTPPRCIFGQWSFPSTFFIPCGVIDVLNLTKSWDFLSEMEKTWKYPKMHFGSVFSTWDWFSMRFRPFATFFKIWPFWPWWPLNGFKVKLKWSKNYCCQLTILLMRNWCLKTKD